jgi:hypothetical protein
MTTPQEMEKSLAALVRVGRECAAKAAATSTPVNVDDTATIDIEDFTNRADLEASP